MNPEYLRNIPENFLTAIKFICEQLQDKVAIIWTVTGSLGFALQGVPVVPHDIDLQTDASSIYKVEQIFSKYSTRKVQYTISERIRSYFGELKINNIKIEIMGDIQKKIANNIWEESIDLSKYIKMLNFSEFSVPVLDLEYEYQAYLKLGRIERATLLRTWLDKK